MAAKPKLFGSRLKKLRKEAGESRYSLSKRTGIDQSYLRVIEQGACELGWSRACALADAYQVSLDSFRERC